MPQTYGWVPLPVVGCFAIKSYCKNETSIQLKLLMDNTKAIAYINRVGGLSPILASLGFDIWQWCLQREISLSAQHIPGIQNSTAVHQSRVHRDSSHWKLTSSVFSLLNNLWGPLQMDLFATRLTDQLPGFVSWRPDTEAEATAAFSQDWTPSKGYAFHPFNLISRCLIQVGEQNVDQLCIVTQIWETQPWYPLLMEVSIDYPRLFPMSPRILNKGETVHPFPHLQLAGWLVSANATLHFGFQSRLKTYSCQSGVIKPLATMGQPGGCGVVGVINIKSIHFLPIFKT